ncbi:hypothetical protein EDB92DRAFT_556729 [Lactarius akahatsu]|uniref:Uncharacterized protein n=1 Tax=Lactarius akahatsu TaxID=416441 RepID=A0AAD4L7U5_9AGAM|nr:hypothetical protein EDB92DRAFT_555484 [Lactarius akahatsu]KAH8978564.1 hypothetical protein EDB92DRAFT_556729 [Lactarius akahatsu]
MSAFTRQHHHHPCSLYSHFSETLSGIATIRAYGEEQRFFNENRNWVNIENRTYWMTVTNQVSLAENSHWIGADCELAVARYSDRLTRDAVDPCRRHTHRCHTLQRLACADRCRPLIHPLRSNVL